MDIFEKRDSHGVWVRYREHVWTPQLVEQGLDSLRGQDLELFDRIYQGLPCAKEFLLTHAEEYGWNEELIARASIFIPAKLPRPVPYFPKHWHCYENSFALAEEKGYMYVEGLAISPTGAAIHAWCSTDGKDVIDYTWPHQHCNKYFGIVYDIQEVRDKGYPFGAILGQLWADTKKKRQKQFVAA